MLREKTSLTIGTHTDGFKSHTLPIIQDEVVRGTTSRELQMLERFQGVPKHIYRREKLVPQRAPISGIYG